MHIWKHFCTITKHRWLVRRYCFKVGLYWQGLIHDLSKYSPTEFWSGARYWQGNRSPNNAEREAKGISMAWLHHKGRNKHHFEYWIDYYPGEKRILGGMPMPKKYIAEMIMDRISACRIYMGSSYTEQAPYNYYLRGTDKFWFIHKNTAADLEMLLKMTAEKGEKETLSYIKNIYLKS